MEEICRVQMNKGGMPNFATAEAIVRCKDCKWCRTYYHGENMPFSYECSKLMLSSIQSTSYCSFAEPKVPQKRCGNCKFLTYRWGKVWCDIKCENPTVDVCDKWKRSE